VGVFNRERRRREKKGSELRASTAPEAVSQMPIQTVESQRLYRQIAEQLSSLTASGDFADGDPMASERAIAGSGAVRHFQLDPLAPLLTQPE
jgi:hypothetical protein